MANLIGNKKTIGETHIYTQEIIKQLKAANDGEIVTYETLTKTIGLETRAPGAGYAYQKSARDILERDESIVFEPVENTGLRRMIPEEVALSTAAAYLKKKRSNIKKYKRRISTVDDNYDQLTPEAKLKTTFARTIIAFDAEMAKSKRVLKIEAVVGEDNKMIGFSDTMELFK